MTDRTHDPALKSWVDSANRPGRDFPVPNLPVGVVVAPEETKPRLGVAIGEFILDAGEWLSGETLNGYFSLPASQRRDLRLTWSRALEAGATKRQLFAQADCVLRLPAAVG